MRRVSWIAACAVATFGILVGGCGGADSATSLRMGTGFLKAQLPAVPKGNLVTALRISSTVDLGYWQAAISPGYSYLDSQNTETSCNGSTTNIPFMICMIESVGITEVGTYSGPAPSGKIVTAVVSNISEGDYTLGAVVTNEENETVFSYKASADGSIGTVEYTSSEIFSGISTPTKIKLVWDSSDPAAQTFSVRQELHSGTPLGMGSQLFAVDGVVDSVAKIADVKYKFLEKIFSKHDNYIASVRLSADAIAIIPARCVSADASGTETLGAECGVPTNGTWQNHTWIDGDSAQPNLSMICGTANNYTSLDVLGTDAAGTVASPASADVPSPTVCGDLGSMTLATTAAPINTAIGSLKLFP